MSWSSYYDANVLLEWLLYSWTFKYFVTLLFGNSTLPLYLLLSLSSNTRTFCIVVKSLQAYHDQELVRSILSWWLIFPPVSPFYGATL